MGGRINKQPVESGGTASKGDKCTRTNTLKSNWNAPPVRWNLGPKNQVSYNVKYAPSSIVQIVLIYWPVLLVINLLGLDEQKGFAPVSRFSINMWSSKNFCSSRNVCVCLLSRFQVFSQRGQFERLSGRISQSSFKTVIAVGSAHATSWPTMFCAPLRVSEPYLFSRVSRNAFAL